MLPAPPPIRRMGSRDSLTSVAISVVLTCHTVPGLSTRFRVPHGAASRRVYALRLPTVFIQRMRTTRCGGLPPLRDGWTAWACGTFPKVCLRLSAASILRLVRLGL